MKKKGSELQAVKICPRKDTEERRKKQDEENKTLTTLVFHVFGYG